MTVQYSLREHLTYLPLPSSWSPVSQLMYKPWLDETDADDILFASINLYAGIHKSFVERYVN